ncbi:MAG: GNAT family N-acetyltransferase [Saccharospirillaceae bacterium]|nr:GNAT family N-acetyltransferase [Pseudomonadales bacterium]NRB80704.1 GNAT family N-acetyltransferase [Saccharospirillaceae bacterium]
MKVYQISTSDNLYNQALGLRYKLFFEEFGLPKDIVKDEFESSSTHHCIYNKEKLVAYGRLTKLENSNFKISQVVVRHSLQRQGYASSLLSGIISAAYSQGAKTIELNSQVKAVSLYKILGFVESGEHYPSKSTAIPHVKMVLAKNT